MDASATNAPRLPRALLVSSFVLPRSGGIEQFVDIAARLLRGRGWRVRVLACRPPAGEAKADTTIPTCYLGGSGWPLPVGGLRTLWREVGEADVVVANGTRHLLPNVAAFAARLRGKRVVFVLHGSGASFATSSFFYHRVLGSLFERLLSRPALRRSHPVSLSRAGVVGCRSRYGVEATYVPFPLRQLPPPSPTPLGSGEPLRIVWAGRLYGEKNPLTAVAVVDRVRRQRPATLEVYGSGPLLDELEELARDRPWLHVCGPRSWEEIQQVQGAAHLCLSTSLRDATQMAVLEPLARGVPVVSTRVGDALGYYARGLWPFCVEPGDPEAAAEAVLTLATSYD
ncbi:MAG TPA: glycosyltransferase family 4 protein, partial [Gaiellaceae bacterium]|nr:glycosyltransferase family 4 protein [Gaiellaceae bacterium]